MDVSYVGNNILLLLQGFVSRYVSENSTDMRHHVWPDIDIKPGDFDVGVIASFGHLIPKNLIEHFPQ